jgi:hypothetical protein
MAVDNESIDLAAQVAFVSINLLGLAVISFAIGHKVCYDGLDSFNGWRSISWMKYLTIGIFLDS